MSGGGKKGRRLPAENPRARAPDAADDCDLSFEVDLSAIRVPLERFVVGTMLGVDLITEGGLEAVVCRLQGGAVVGSLAAFEGLSKLIDCIRRRNRYVAEVVRIDRGTCRVKVGRTSR